MPSLWIEHAGELDGRWLENKSSVGIAAGGSTPDWLIKELIQKLEENIYVKMYESIELVDMAIIIADLRKNEKHIFSIMVR